MGPLIISAIVALAFSWMWQRNSQATKFLNRLSGQGDQQALFDEWKIATTKWLSSLNWASFLLTMLPLSLLLILVGDTGGGISGGATAPTPVVLIFNVLFWGSVANFVRWLMHKSRANRLALALSLPKGVGWLAKGRLPETPATPPTDQSSDPP